jgi:hypothetical protein
MTTETPTRWAFLRRVNRTAVIVVLAVLLVVTASIAGYLFSQYQQLKNDPAAANAAQTATLVEQVGKLMVLPAGQTPTVATVSDKSKLASQPFFKDAKNGDQLLIYSEAKEAIIYRPSDNKIINVGPIALNSSGAGVTAPSESPVPDPSPTSTPSKKP